MPLIHVGPERRLEWASQQELEFLDALTALGQQIAQRVRREQAGTRPGLITALVSEEVQRVFAGLSPGTDVVERVRAHLCKQVRALTLH